MKKQLAKKKRDRNKIYRHLISNHIFLNNGYTGELTETCRRIELYSGVILKYIDNIRNCSDIDFRGQRKWNKKHGFPKHFPDYRKGAETYGYANLERIEGNLNYISDRFSAEFRLQWMLELPEEIKKLHNNQ